LKNMTRNLRRTLKSVKLQEFHQPLQGKLLLIFLKSKTHHCLIFLVDGCLHRNDNEHHLLLSCCNYFHIDNDERLFLFVIATYKAMTTESFFFHICCV
jgi:hypothetical protein